MKQITFNRPTMCTHVYPDGREERVQYGQYEAINIISENGWDTNRVVILIIPTFLVEEVVREDGIKVIFDKPFYCIVEEEFGDGSGRLARHI